MSHSSIKTHASEREKMDHHHPHHSTTQNGNGSNMCKFKMHLAMQLSHTHRWASDACHQRKMWGWMKRIEEEEKLSKSVPKEFETAYREHIKQSKAAFKKVAGEKLDHLAAGIKSLAMYEKAFADDRGMTKMVHETVAKMSKVSDDIMEAMRSMKNA